MLQNKVHFPLGQAGAALAESASAGEHGPGPNSETGRGREKGQGCSEQRPT